MLIVNDCSEMFILRGFGPLSTMFCDMNGYLVISELAHPRGYRNRDLKNRIKVVFISNAVGYGVFATEDIGRGEVVCRYGGAVIATETGDKRRHKGGKPGSYMVQLKEGYFDGFNCLEEVTGPKRKLYVGGRINAGGSCCANCEINNSVIGLRNNQYLHVTAIKDIEAGTQLLCVYEPYEGYRHVCGDCDARNEADDGEVADEDAEDDGEGKEEEEKDDEGEEEDEMDDGEDDSKMESARERPAVIR